MGSRVSVTAGKKAIHLANPAEITTFITDTLAKDKVVIFSKSYCPYCKLAKEVFQAEKHKATVIELDERTDGASILSSLTDLTGSKTVPQVFIGGKFVGGGSDVKALQESGSLHTLLDEEEPKKVAQ